MGRILNLMSKSLSVALVQAAPFPVDAPLSEFAACLDRVLADTGADLVVYPELHLFGDLVDQEKHAQPLAGQRIRELGAIAADAGVWLIPGTVAEKGPAGELFNTAVVFSPTGELVASYRKCFPWRPFEPHRPGTGFTVFDIPEYGRFGLSICYDTWFPEVARQLAWLGAEVIITPTRTTTADRPQELVLTRANCIANQVFTLSCNIDDSGRSLVVDPEGRVLAESGKGVEVLTAEIDVDRVRQVREDGTVGLNRMWRQFTPADEALDLPVYQGKIDPTTWRGNT